MKDPYLYPNSETLINLFNETDNASFNAIEADYTSLRIKELLDNPIVGNFDLHHLCEIHKYVFQDIFDWAGKLRIINIEKSEEALSGLSVEYSDVFEITKHSESALSKMNSTTWDDLSSELKATAFAEGITEIWKVHPFREGNTRTIVTFCCDFADKRGFPLDRELFKDNSAYVRRALVASSAFFKDLGDKRKPEFLVNFIHDAIQRAQTFPQQGVS
jgi:cell filamentation protein